MRHATRDRLDSSPQRDLSPSPAVALDLRRWGAYSFAPWKVAISGLYKKLAFACVGPVDGRPVVFDDTVSFLPFQTEAEARAWLAIWLNSSDLAQTFLGSMIFWTDKRPITAAVLRGRLARPGVGARRGCCLGLFVAASKDARNARAPSSMKACSEPSR